MALALICVLLCFTFGSITQSILIFTAIPLSAIGGIFALLIRGMPFSISAGVGFIALFGVAVLNGIVLISEFNFLKKNGLTNITEIILKGTTTRLRPVLMTASVASLGFLPMALSHGAGAEVQKPLATVVIGGLVSATFLTLIVLPCLYVFFEKGFRFKIKPVANAILLLIVINLFPQNINAQIKQTFTLDEAIQKAQKNNLSVKSGLYEIDLQKTLKKTASDIGKTNLTWLGGQYNSLEFDNSFAISQTFPFFGTFKKNDVLYSSKIKSAELKLQITQNELAYRVKTTYYNLLFVYAQHEILEKQDSILTQFLKASELRLKTGEGTVLEKSTAQTQLFEVKNLLAQNNADKEIFKTQLSTLLNSPDLIDISEKTLGKRRFQFEDTTGLTQNPMYQYLQQQIEVSQKNIAVEKSILLPDITLGYINQSLKGIYTVGGQDVFYGGSRRFQSVEVGIAIPIWAKPQKSRIAGAKISEQIVQTQADLYQKTLKSEIEQAVQQYIKFENTLQYYESQILPNTEIILSNAQKAFQSGDIGYVEYSQALTRVLGSQINYLSGLNSCNQAIIQIEFLLGK